MIESERFLYHKYMEDHYQKMVKEYERELMEDHIAMTFEKLPLSEEVKQRIGALFTEYLINLSVIKTYNTIYKGSKLTMEELNHLENLILKGMFRIFDMANKDKIHGGNVCSQMKYFYDMLKIIAPDLRLDFINIGYDNEGFLCYEVT